MRRPCSVLRIVKRIKALRLLLGTFLVTLPSVANVGALVCLVIFVYAIVCMNLLGQVAYGTSPWSALSAHGNFGTFPNSFLSLVCARRRRPPCPPHSGRCLTRMLCVACAQFRMTTVSSSCGARHRMHWARAALVHGCVCIGLTPRPARVCRARAGST